MRCSDWSSDVCSSDPSLVHGTNNDHLDHRSYAARCGNKASEHDRIAHQPFQHRRKKRQHRKNQYAKKKSQQGSKKEIAILEQRHMDEGSTCCQNVDDNKVQEECRCSRFDADFQCCEPVFLLHHVHIHLQLSNGKHKLAETKQIK